MLAVLERNLGNKESIISVNRYSHYIPEIKDASVQVFLAAHSVHWFDYRKTIIEFQRIAREDADIFIIHNSAVENDELSAATAKIIDRYRIAAPGQGQDHANIHRYFQKESPQQKYFDFATVRNFDSYIGSLLSSSFMPNEEDAVFPSLKEEANDIFLQFSTDGQISVKTRTSIMYGKLKRGSEKKMPYNRVSGTDR